MTPASRKSSRSRPAAKRRRKKSASPARAVPWTLGIAFVVLACGIGLMKWSRTDGGQATLLEFGADRMHADVQLAVERALGPVLPGLRPGPAVADGDNDRPAPSLGDGAVIRCRTVAVPEGRTWWQVQDAVDAALADVGAGVLWGERLPGATGRRQAAVADEDTDLLRLDLGVQGNPTHTLLLHREGRTPTPVWDGSKAQTAWQEMADTAAPTIALIIDDWGYGRNDVTRRILDLDIPFTMAVLPGLSYSRHFALQGTDIVLPRDGSDFIVTGDATRASRLAAGCPVELSVSHERSYPRRRREIMLHWPMQPESVWNPGLGRWMLYVGMKSDVIDERLTVALAGLPNVRGINNHMGSASTSDAETMTELMKVLRERGFYFVDSLTTSRSLAWETAQAYGVPSLRNRTFLDATTETADQVRSKLEVLVRSARKQGFAVGIGHPHPLTAEVLAREVPRLQAEGIRFVTVSEMLALSRVAGGNS